MKQIAVYVEDDMHELIGLLAKKHNTSRSRLVLAAIEDTYEDQLDAIAGELGLAEYLADPSSTITIEEFRRQMDEKRRAEGTLT